MMFWQQALPGHTATSSKEGPHPSCTQHSLQVFFCKWQEMLFLCNKEGKNCPATGHYPHQPVVNIMKSTARPLH